MDFLLRKTFKPPPCQARDAVRASTKAALGDLDNSYTRWGNRLNGAVSLVYLVRVMITGEQTARMDSR